MGDVSILTRGEIDKVGRSRSSVVAVRYSQRKHGVVKMESGVSRELQVKIKIEPPKLEKKKEVLINAVTIVRPAR